MSYKFNNAICEINAAEVITGYRKGVRRGFASRRAADANCVMLCH
jgi:hypothetical protein